MPADRRAGFRFSPSIRYACALYRLRISGSLGMCLREGAQSWNEQSRFLDRSTTCRTRRSCTFLPLGGAYQRPLRRVRSVPSLRLRVFGALRSRPIWGPAIRQIRGHGEQGCEIVSACCWRHTRRFRDFVQSQPGCGSAIPEWPGDNRFARKRNVPG